MSATAEAAVLEAPPTQTAKSAGVAPPAPPHEAVPEETESSPAETRIILQDVSWQLYERMLAEHPDRPSPRFAYNEGSLEIMTVGVAHENPNRTLATLVGLIAEEWDLDLLAAGQVTCKRRDLKKGFEPDSCFYFGANAVRLQGRKKLILPRDPAPELIIEIDITHSSLPRQPIFAAFGVAELWRHDGRSVRIFHLENGVYVEAAVSPALSPLNGETATLFLEESQTLRWPIWSRHIREWAQAQIASGARHLTAS